MADIGSLLRSRQFWVLAPWLLMAAVGAGLQGSAQAGFLALYNGESHYLNGFWAWPQRVTLNVRRRLGMPESPGRLVGTGGYWRFIAVFGGGLGGIGVGATLMLSRSEAVPFQSGPPPALLSLAFLGSTSLIMGLGAWYRGNQILRALRQLGQDGHEEEAGHNAKTVGSMTSAFFGCGMVSSLGVMQLGEVVVRCFSGGGQ